MTDKEWDALCSWAREKELKELIVTSLFIGDCIGLYIKETDTALLFYKDGRAVIAGRTIKHNLKQAQIKAIIENLL